MDESTGSAPEQPPLPPGAEQETGSSPIRGIAFGLALSAVLWFAILLLLRLLSGSWLAAGLLRVTLDTAGEEASVAADDAPPPRTAVGAGRSSPRPA